MLFLFHKFHVYNGITVVDKGAIIVTSHERQITTQVFA